MKLEQVHKDRVVANVMDYLKDRQRRLDGWAADMRDANTVKELMVAKQNMLTDMVGLPLGYGHCYFCSIHDSECDHCQYATVHGRCSTANNESDFAHISEAQQALTKALEHYYHDYVDYFGDAEDEEKEEDAKVYKDIIAKAIQDSDGDLHNRFIDADGDELECIQAALCTNYRTQGAFYKAAFGVNEDEAENAGWHPEDIQFDDNCDGWVQFIRDKGVIKVEKVILERSLDAKELGKFLLDCSANGVSPNDAYLPRFLG